MDTPNKDSQTSLSAVEAAFIGTLLQSGYGVTAFPKGTGFVSLIIYLKFSEYLRKYGYVL